MKKALVVITLLLSARSVLRSQNCGTILTEDPATVIAVGKTINYDPSNDMYTVSGTTEHPSFAWYCLRRSFRQNEIIGGRVDESKNTFTVSYRRKLPWWVTLPPTTATH